MEERCELCKHFHKLKYDFQRGVGFKESYCCDVLLHIDDDDEGWVQETDPNGMCEMFVRNVTCMSEEMNQKCRYLELCAEEAKNKDWGSGIKFALEFIKDAIDCNNRDYLNCVLNRIQAELLLREENIKVIRRDNNCFFTASEIIKIIDEYKV